MTLSPESRAATVAKIINASADDNDLITEFGQIVIATAIRKAETSLVRRLIRNIPKDARLLLPLRSGRDGHYWVEPKKWVRQATKRIRSLKSKR